MGIVPSVSAAVNISNSPNWKSWAPRAVFDSSGNLYVVWSEVYTDRNGDLFFSKYTKSSKTWSSPQNLSNSGRVWSDTAEVSGIDADDSNQIHVVWTEQGAVRLRTLAGGSWGGVESVGSGNNLEGAKIAATGTGDLYIVWWGSDGQVISRSRVSGSWEGARSISAGGRRSKFPDVAAGNGAVMAVWAENTGSVYQTAYVLRGKSYGTGWSSPARVSSQSISQQHPAIEFLNNETPQVIYTPVVDPNRYVAHAAWTGSGFGSPRKLSDESMLHYPSLAEKSGAMLAVWQVGSYGSGQAVYYAGYSNGQWGAQTAVPASNGCTFCDAAIDPTGSAAVVWDASGEIMAEISGGITPPVPNVAPVAIFSFLPTTGSAPLTVNFDASASYDPDGQIVRHDWVFGDGETASGRTVTHTFATPGVYANTLTVIDNLGKTGTTTHSLEVVNLPPVPGFSFLPTTGSAPLTVNFDASASYDPDGRIDRYDWVFGDGQTASGSMVSHTFATPGVYANKLTVTDNLGKTGTITKSLEAVNLPPVPGFNITPPTGIIPITVTFDAGPSFDPDGAVIQYDWIFSDGDFAQGRTIARVFTVPGIYSVRLTVFDNFRKSTVLVKTFEILSLKPPLNVRWASFSDVSLFMTRYVTDVQWEANPANDPVAVITKYRIYRQDVSGVSAVFQICGETDGSTFFWRDVKVKSANQFVYIVTAMDAVGHESPLGGASMAPTDRNVKNDGRSFPARSPLIKR